jgi:hypothetical protein
MIAPSTRTDSQARNIKRNVEDARTTEAGAHRERRKASTIAAAFCYQQLLADPLQDKGSQRPDRREELLPGLGAESIVATE